MEVTYSRRTLGHLSRKRMASVEKPLTPSDELSSWLGDDLCAQCSHPTKGGQLYCSKECRQQDEQNEVLANERARAEGRSGSLVGGSSESSPLQRVASPTISESQDGKQQSHNRPASTSSLEDRSFRYPLPPSPNLLAQYHYQSSSSKDVSSSSSNIASSSTTSALTSPALTAFQRSLPQQSSRGRSLQFSNKTSSGSHPQRRSSSQSTTYSSNSASASDNAYTTDPSTTSPNAVGAISDEDMEPSDLNLPPSAASASVVLLKANGGARRSTSASSSSNSPAAVAAQSQGSISSNPSPSSSNSATASGPMSIKSPIATFSGAGSTMKYARRPSSTNLQPPVLYSPALAPTTSKINAVRARMSSSNSRNTTSRSYDAERKLRMGSMGVPKKNQLQEMRRHSDDATDGKGREEEIKTPIKDCPSESNPRTSLMVRSQTEKTLERSPPLSSVASSTTKTVHALSPKGSIQAVCGRYGCRGSSTRRESIGELASSLRSSSIEDSHGAVSSTSPSSSESPSPPRSTSRPSRHQHTHSAIAGLGDLPRLTASAIKALTMTPALDARRAPTAPSSPSAAQRRGRSPARRPSQGSGNGKDFVEDAAAAIERGTPPRGRSKARGPRSTSRRSESPSRVLGTGNRVRSGSPRAGARAQASAEPAPQTEGKVQRSDSETSNPPSPLSPRSHPISITRSGRLGPLSSGRIRPQEGDEGMADDEAGISPLALRAHRSNDRSSSRGRRNNGTSSRDVSRDRGRDRDRDSKIRSNPTSQERGRGKSRDPQLARGSGLNRIEKLQEIPKKETDLDPGFDDVDDIEL